MKFKISFVDLKTEYQKIRSEINFAIKAVVEQTDFILGKEVELFEQEFARYIGTKYCIGVSSGTDALELALRSLNVSKDDEVIVPTLSFYSTAVAVCYLYAKPVFVDVDYETGNIDVGKIEVNITKRTKAIIPVHLYGNPVDMKKLMLIAKKFRLKVIEDACQAHGAIYKFGVKEQKVGSIGDVGCFSFYPAKNLGCYGDGGAVVTDNYQIAQKIKFLRDYGRREKYIHHLIGYNRRLDTLQAAILRVKLKYLSLWNEKRRKIAAMYNSMLKNIGDVRPMKTTDNCVPVYHLYVVRTSKRDELKKFLLENGIGVGIHYPLPLHLQPAFRFLGYRKGDFPVAEKLTKEILSLPMYPFMKEHWVEIICKLIKKFYEKKYSDR
ncbi:MAG: DegT/DnrJ/EryC1/StrS family aminotransferase [Endomicrobia bacterium]|nr:DegT/DnrJ/EryC1/StrS family aminotransferase [Endomicrobiia bacterium]